MFIIFGGILLFFCVPFIIYLLIINDDKKIQNFLIIILISLYCVRSSNFTLIDKILTIKKATNLIVAFLLCKERLYNYLS